MPDSLEVFPDNYFRYIVHNHVMEHVPGSFQDALLAQLRVLEVGGMLIFSVPGPKMSSETISGGEFMETDEERLKVFGQIDHIKLFGKDLPGFMDEVEEAEFWFDKISDEDRARISVPPDSCRVMVWKKVAERKFAQINSPDKFLIGAARLRGVSSGI